MRLGPQLFSLIVGLLPSCSLFLDPPQYDECDQAVDPPHCEGDRVVSCEGGFLVRRRCPGACDEALAACECGDGRVEGFEQCDDGNRDDGDGCDASCRLPLERVATTTVDNNQDEPFAIAGNDGFLLLFEDESTSAPDRSESAVRARVLNACGDPIGNDFVLSEVVSGAQENARGAAGARGTYLVAWSDETVRARVLNGDGSFASNEIVVPTSTLGGQSNPSVAAAPDGSFLVVWHQDEREIRGRIFDAFGAARGPELRVSDAVRPGSDYPAAVLAASDRYLVVWQAREADLEIFFRFLDLAGAPLSPEARLNTSTGGDQERPALALGMGVSMAVWTDTGPGTRGRPNHIAGRLIGPEGPRGDDFPVSPGTGNQGDAAIAGAPGRAFRIVWAEEDLVSAGIADVRERMVAFDGTQLGESDLRVNTIYAADQDDPAVAAGPQGHVVAWGDKSGVLPDPSLDSVRFRFLPYDPATPCEP